MTTISTPRRLRTLFTGLLGLGAAAVIAATADATSASAATPAPTVHSATTSLHTTPVRSIHVTVTARHAHLADHLSVQQYFHRAWHTISSYRVGHSSTYMRHTFDLGNAPAGRYYVRVALVRHTHRLAKTGVITITCTNPRPPQPPTPPQ